MATHLNDSQRIILAAAAARGDRGALPFPDSLRAPAPAIAKTVKALIGSGLLAETPAQASEAVWREDETAGRIGLVITPTGLAAIGIGPDHPQTNEVSSEQIEAPKNPTSAPEATIGKSSKQNIVVALLRRGTGASIKEIEAATGWQAHSVRGFLSGTLKRRLNLEVVSVKDAQTGERRYQIAVLRSTKD